MNYEPRTTNYELQTTSYEIRYMLYAIRYTRRYTLYAVRYFLPRFTLYASRFTKLPSTSVEIPLHLSRTLYKSALFMQNEPNFRKSQVNVTSLITVAYENKSNWTLGENEPNTNPIRTQSNPIKPNLPEGKIDAKYVFTKDYEEKCG